MEKIFGHQNPDTDTICSAIAYADLKINSASMLSPSALDKSTAKHNTRLIISSRKARVWWKQPQTK